MKQALNVERGAKRVAWVISGSSAVLWIWRVERAWRFDNYWFSERLNELTFVFALCAAAPWVLFFVGRWIVRGFREDWVTHEDAALTVRHAKRWKRWVGYYLLLGGSLGVATEIPLVASPLRVRDLIYFSLELLFVGWGLCWVVKNRKAKEVSLYPKGDSAIVPRHDRRVRIVLAIVLLAALLMVYQLFFMPRLE